MSAEHPASAAPNFEAAAAAVEVFGNRLTIAQRYAQLLAGDGVAHGLLGPREVGRLWDRHLLNCAIVADLLPAQARIVDVGSGAGLPGLPLAIRRADLRVDLVEPMLRRTRFLTQAVRDLSLGESVTVVRGRAADPAVLGAVGDSNWVVARAVAPLDRLVKWCLPLLADGGRLLALKGASAKDELAQHATTLGGLGAGALDLLEVTHPGCTSTWVVSVQRATPKTRSTRKAP